MQGVQRLGMRNEGQQMATAVHMFECIGVRDTKRPLSSFSPSHPRPTLSHKGPFLNTWRQCENCILPTRVRFTHQVARAGLQTPANDGFRSIHSPIAKKNRCEVSRRILKATPLPAKHISILPAGKVEYLCFSCLHLILRVVSDYFLRLTSCGISATRHHPYGNSPDIPRTPLPASF